jgi:hypothetical protein
MADNTHGLLAAFETPGAIMAAAEKVRDAGYRRWDVHTPFPVHGMDHAMGLRRSKVPRFTLVGGLTGFTTGMLMIWWMGGVDYPLIVGGKPLFSPLFAFPPSYELTILLASFGSIIGMFVLNRLAMHYHPVIKHGQANRVTSDRFFVVIDARDPEFHPTKTREFLLATGATEVSELEN